MMNYKSKYYKYKLKYLELKKNNNQSGGNVTVNPSILGFGTDGVNDPKIIKKAIDTSYVYFDTAQSYNNIDMIAQVINETKSRDKIFINYKTKPPYNLDKDRFKEDIENAIQKFTYLDCFMFHTIEDFYIEYIHLGILNKKLIEEQRSKREILMNDIINFLKTKVSEGKIRSIGISNVASWYTGIISYFKQINLPIEYIQNKFNSNLINNEKTIDIVNYCNTNNIKFIGYGALGSKDYGACRITYNFEEPLIYFDKITHPKTFDISKKYNLDIFMMILASLTKKYSVVQIPTTSSELRVINNFNNFNEAINRLTTQDIDEIIKECSKKNLTNPLLLSLPKQIVDKINYNSRINLFNYLYSKNHPIITTINIIIPYCNDEQQSDIINIFLFLYELMLKMNFDDKIFVERINIFNNKLIQFGQIKRIVKYIILKELSLSICTLMFKDQLKVFDDIERKMSMINKMGYFDIVNITIGSNVKYTVIDTKKHKIYVISLSYESTVNEFINIFKKYDIDTNIYLREAISKVDENGEEIYIKNDKGEGIREMLPNAINLEQDLIGSTPIYSLFSPSELMFINYNDINFYLELEIYPPDEYPEIWGLI